MIEPDLEESNPQLPANDQRRMYGDLAWLWPIISPPEDYVTEARQFAGLIRRYSQIEVQSLLHLGCGGGHIDFTIQEYFKVTGVDISPQMLALARQLNPGVSYLVGDMRTVRLDEVFDAVLIADSIAYMLTEAELLAAFETAYQHLKPGGVFCTYAEETKERFRNNATYCDSHGQGQVEVAFIGNHYDPDPGDTSYEDVFIYLIRQAGNLRIETDRHLSGIFPVATWCKLLEYVGFQVEQLEFEGEGFPFFIGLKRRKIHGFLAGL